MLLRKERRPPNASQFHHQEKGKRPMLDHDGFQQVSNISSIRRNIFNNKGGDPQTFREEVEHNQGSKSMIEGLQSFMIMQIHSGLWLPP